MVGADDTHVYGVAPKANFIGCLSLNGSTGTLDAALDCWQFALQPSDLDGENADTSRRAHIVSNSWGFVGYHTIFEMFRNLADVLRAAGIFVAIAAGNSGEDGCGTISSPGVYENVFTVGAVDNTGDITDFSSRGPVPEAVGSHIKPDVCVPGLRIRSSIPGGHYGISSGTSMATPQVAAAVALLWEAIPALNRDVESTEQLLRISAQGRASTECGSTLQSIPNYLYGHGNIKILDALDAFYGNFTPIPPKPSPSPPPNDDPILNSAFSSNTLPAVHWFLLLTLIATVVAHHVHMYE